MSDKASIYAAFVKAQKEFAPALKTATNPAFRSRYVDLSGCVEAVLDALNNHGIGLIQRTFEDMTGVTIETVFIHESGESLEGGKLHVPASKQDPQGYGSALTYARRYSLMAACGIAPEDDDGNAASQGRQQPTKAAARAQKIEHKEEGPVTDAAVIATHISALEACKTLESLKKTYEDAFKATRGAPAVTAAKNKYKTILEAGQ